MAKKSSVHCSGTKLHKIAFAILCSFVIIPLSACGKSSAEKTAEPYSDKNVSSQSPAPSPQTKSTNDLVDPLDAYNLTVDEKNIVQSASNKLVSECMHKKGFNLRDDYVGLVKYTDNDDKIDRNPQLWGLISDADIAKFGYNSDPNSDAHGKILSTEESDKYKDYFHALINDVDGCQLKADAPVYEGTYESKENQAQDADFHKEAESQALADNRVTSLVSAWSKCMKDAGYNYSTPLDAANAPWKAEPDKAEIDTAKADMACKEKVDLFKGYTRVLFEKESELIKSKYLPTFTENKKLLDRRLKQAQDILAK
ncbi:MAG: hypothetical protein LBI63_05160 [Candidatus Ancillula sp.]|nr:hypothetical protein [Candidatus Ancillula sp.]